MDKISVIIPCRNEEKYIADCLDSVIKTDYPKAYMEVFVVDGMSSDSTQQIINNYVKKYDFIKLLINKNKTPPFALNMAIKASSGEYIIRIDAHGEIPGNYFSELIKWGKKLNADNIGAQCRTEVKNKNKRSIAIKKVLINRFGVGNSLFRTGIRQITEVDTVPFGCFKREILQKAGLFDERLTRNQDIELNKRIKRVHGKIFLLPDLFSVYYARETFGKLSKNLFQTGMWNLLTVYFTRRFDSLSLRHFIPLLFILSLIVPLLLMLWIPAAGFLSALSFVSYLAANSFVSLQIYEKDTSFFQLFTAFAVVHISYGIGSVYGLLKVKNLFK